VTVGMRNLRENFPKAFRYQSASSSLALDLWPAEVGPLNLATTSAAKGPGAFGRGSAFGLAKTHQMIFYFHKGNARNARSRDVAISFMEPLLMRPNPYWVDATGALGRLFPVDSRYATEEKMLEKLFNWAERHPRLLQWYGMLNFGDTLTWWRHKDEENVYGQYDWHPIGRWGWYNNEGVGTHTGALLQYARSGDWKYFEFGENLTRHLMDIDTVHHDTISSDRRIKKKLNSKYSQVGSMHRHNGQHWGGRSDEASHTSVIGILLYYYLTGDERALDVAKEIGEFFLKESFTYAGHPYIAPSRGLANALWGDVWLYQTTGDERYKKAADKLINLFLKGQQTDGSFLENYNPLIKTWHGEKHQLYMTDHIVGALISYHQLTQDPEVLQALLKLVRYLAQHEYSATKILHGFAYAYQITKDPLYLAHAEQNLKIILRHQHHTRYPIVAAPIPRIMKDAYFSSGISGTDRDLLSFSRINNHFIASFENPRQELGQR